MMSFLYIFQGNWERNPTVAAREENDAREFESVGWSNSSRRGTFLFYYSFFFFFFLRNVIKTILRK